jgi:hypothetical protein
MPNSELLTADQRAVLQLVLRRGRSYAQIATALKSDEGAIRERAASALGALTAGQAGDSRLSSKDRAVLTDHVLGQGDPAIADSLLDRSAPARAWVRVASEALAGEGLTDAAPSKAPAPAPPEVAEQHTGRVSKTGGAIILGLLAAAVVLGVLWLSGVFDGTDSGGNSAVDTTTTQTGTTTGTRILQQINLKPPPGVSSPALAVANVAQQDTVLALAVVGQKLPASSFYALWLQRGTTWKRLGFFPPVRPDGKTKGRLSGAVRAPSDLLSYSRLVISNERTSSPKAPNSIVLTGSIGR